MCAASHRQYGYAGYSYRGMARFAVPVRKGA